MVCKLKCANVGSFSLALEKGEKEGGREKKEEKGERRGRKGSEE